MANLVTQLSSKRLGVKSIAFLTAAAVLLIMTSGKGMITNQPKSAIEAPKKAVTVAMNRAGDGPKPATVATNGAGSHQTEPADDEETSETRLHRVNAMCQELGINQDPNLAGGFKTASHHILVDDTHKIMYCYVPKAGCTSWKGFMMSMASGLNMSYFNDWGQAAFHLPNRHRGMNLSYLSDYEIPDQQKRLKNYFKFMFIRNPFARLISIFNDRFKYIDILAKTPFWHKMKKKIDQDSRNISYPQDDKLVSFKEFATYVGTYDRNGRFNPHFYSATHWCQPCVIQYDYLGKQETMARDTRSILSRIGKPELYDSMPHRNAHGQGELLRDYYKNVSMLHLFSLIDNFKNDSLLFGYRVPDIN